MKKTAALLCSLIFVSLQAGIGIAVGPDQKFKTIQSAVASLPQVFTEPVTITVTPGIYREEVKLSRLKTSPAAPLTIRAIEPGSVIIDAEKKRKTAMTLVQQQYVICENLTMVRGCGFGSLFLNGSNNNRFSGCVFAFGATANSDGIIFSGSSGNRIEHCVLAYNGRAGATLVNSSKKNTFRFNLFYRNVKGISTNADYPSKPLTVEYNGFFGHRKDLENAEAKQGCIFADPKFVNPLKLDFHFRKDSPCDRWGIYGAAGISDPAPRSGASYFQLDLSRVANASLQDEKAGDRSFGWTDQGTLDLRHLPSGLTRLNDGVDYNLPVSPKAKAVLVLNGVNTPDREKAVKDIPVNRQVEKLYFLHGCAWARNDAVYQVIVHYADGREIGITMRNRRELGDWYNPKDYPAVKTAWSQKHPLHPTVRLGLYGYAWNNPYPFSVIRSIDLISCQDGTPMIAAISGKTVSEKLAANLHLSAAVRGKKLTGTADFSVRGQGEYILSVRLLGEKDSAVAPEFRKKISITSKTGCVSTDFSFMLPGSQVDCNYCLEASVRTMDNKTAALKKTYLSQSGTAQSMPQEKQLDPALPVGGANVLYSAEVQPLIQIHRNLYKAGKRPRRIPETIFDQLKKNNCTVVHLICWWNYLEPAPFQYDFEHLEWAVKCCQKRGMKASISVWMGDHNVPEFCYGEDMLDQKGRVFLDGRGTNWGSGHHPSIWGPLSRRHFTGLIGEIIRRYKDDDRVVAWGFMYQHVEVAIHDRKGKDLYLYDYSPWAQQNFRRYLRDVRHFSLEALNARYGTHFTSYEQVVQPQPRAGLDVTPQWNDFQDFRIYSARSIFELVFQTIRQHDPTRKKIAFVFNPVFSYDLCEKYGIVVDSTSSEDPLHRNEAMQAKTFSKVALVQEPCTIPPNIYELNAGFFNALSVPAQGYIYVGNASGTMPVDTAAARLFQKNRHAWERLSDAGRKEVQIGIFRNYDTQHAVEKLFSHGKDFEGDTSYQRMLQVLGDGQFDYYSVTDIMMSLAGPEKLPHVKVMLDFDGRVMRKNVMDCLLRRVAEEGMTLIMMPQTGRYCREKPLARYSLAARIGWETAAGADFLPLENSAGEAGGFVFAERYPVDRLPGEHLRGKDGSAYAVKKTLGKGHIVMLAGMPAWEKSFAGVEKLLLECGVVRPIVTRRGVRGAVTVKDRSTFVLLFNENPVDFTPCRVKLPTLPEGKYRLHRVTNNSCEESPETDCAQWRNGVPVLLAPYELRIYELKKR